MSENDWQRSRTDSAADGEPKVAAGARGLDRRLRGVFAAGPGVGQTPGNVSSATPGTVRAERSGQNIAGGGLAPVIALKRLVEIEAGSELASDDVLLAHYGAVPGPANLGLLGEELGVELTLHEGRKGGLKKARAPFVCLLPDDTALAVIGKNAKGHWICIGAGGRVALPGRELERVAGGSWIGVSPGRSDPEEDRAKGATGPDRGGQLSLLRRFAGLVFENQGPRLFQLWAAAGLSNLILIVLPLFITIVYDRVIPYGAFETLAALSIGVVLVFAIDTGLRSTRIALQEAIGVGAGQKLQALFYRKLLCVPLAHGHKSSSGVSALMGEVDHVALSLPSLFAGLLADLPFIVLMLGLVAFLGGPVVIVPVVGIIVIALINVVGSLRARRAAGKAHRLRLRLQDETFSSTAMLPTLKALSAEQELLSRWEKTADETAFEMNRARQAAAISAQSSLVVTQLIVAFTIVAGAVQINSGAMTLGNLAASVLLVGRILAPVSQVVSQVGQLSNMTGALRTFFGVIDLEDEQGGDEVGNPAGNIRGRIELRKVSFSYQGAVYRSLAGIDLTIEPGERVGIIGRNGCGKSTLLKLIPRFFDPDEGTYMLDGFDARQVSPRLLRRSVGFMSQDTVLMQGSLRVNVTLGLEHFEAADFERAMQVSGVHALARRHPEGYNMNVGPRGEALSGGERQQVGLARILLRNPRILILDEPTSAMDNSTEGALIGALPGYLEGRGLILATHRTQMLALVDRVILMENGRIVADGPKQQVLSSLLKAS